MEDRKFNAIAVLSIFFLVLLIIVTRILLKLSNAFFLICGVDVAVIAAVFVYFLIRRSYNHRRKRLESQLSSTGKELRIEYSFLRKVAGVPTKFRLKELEEATDNFRSLLGQGASASVYKGILSDGTAVAVKRIEGEEHGDKVFRSEVAAIASVQHVHLVRLHGYSINPAGPRFLVYEYIPNGSLDCWIFPNRPNRSNRPNRPGGCLSWQQRYKVAIDVAKALAYLHHDCRSRILHLDVKPENILLDENHRAIVSDFGLSKLMGKDESRIVTTLRGTKGYLAPEWLLEQGISEKSDIYSYGMVLLEMIGGQRNVSLIENEKKSKRKWKYFPKIVNEKMKEGKLMEIVDQRVVEENGKTVVDEREVKRLVSVALWCIQEKARLRPTMGQVVEMLEGRLNVDEPPDTDMIIVDLLSVDVDDEDDDLLINNNHNKKKFFGLERERGENRNDLPSSSSNCSFGISVLSGR